MTNYLVYDVFTDTPFGGNQLAIIPDATGLPDADLPQITREFNFSETVFLFPPDNPDHTAKVRIFTPTLEIPFAGHPTIGTAVALRDMGHQGDMILELGVGPIPCRFDGKQASFTTSVPLEKISQPSATLVAACLGLTPDQIIGTPTQASLGLPFVIVQLRDDNALAQCQPNIAEIRKAIGDHPVGHDFAIHAYTQHGNQINARMFAPLDNIPEDPATGSAAATLAALLTDATQTPQTLHISQGVQMGRPSTIHAQTTLTSVTISGEAVKMMEGTLAY